MKRERALALMLAASACGGRTTADTSPDASADAATLDAPVAKDATTCDPIGSDPNNCGACGHSMTVQYRAKGAHYPFRYLSKNATHRFHPSSAASFL